MASGSAAPPRSLASHLGLIVVAYASGVLLSLALWAELYWFHTRLVMVLAAPPVIAFVAWWSAREPGGRRTAIVRATSLTVLVLLSMLLFDRQNKEGIAWFRWVPMMVIDNSRLILESIPWLPFVCLAGLALSWYIVVHRLGRGAFLVAWAWPMLWLIVGMRGFYLASFDTSTAAQVLAQPGVKILAPNDEHSCSFFASRCSPQLFPRALHIDERTRTAFASFGSTFADLHRERSKLLAVGLDSGKSEWLEGTEGVNQLRTFDLDPAQRLLAFSQWGSDYVALYDTDTKKRVEKIQYPKEPDEDPTAAGVLLDGDAIVSAHIWYPQIVRYTRHPPRVDKTVDLYDLGYVENGVQVSNLAMSRKRGKVWVVIAQPGIAVLEMDSKTLTPQDTLDLDVRFQGTIAYDDDTGRLYVTSFSSPRLEVVDVDSMQRVDVLDGVIGSRGCVVDNARRMLYLTDYGQGQVAFYSLAERRIVRRLRVGPKPAEAALSGDRLYVNSGLGIVSLPVVF